METTLPEGLVVRPLRVSDAEQFHALQQLPSVARAHPHAPYRPIERTREWIGQQTPPTLAIGAWVDDTLVGEADLTPERQRRAHAGTIGISVHDAWQRRGIGTRLMTELIDLADNWLGLRRLELHVFTDNHPALALYRKSGFEVEALQRGTVLRDGVLADSYLMARLHEPAPLALSSTE